MRILCTPSCWNRNHREKNLEKCTVSRSSQENENLNTSAVIEKYESLIRALSLKASPSFLVWLL